MLFLSRPLLGWLWTTRVHLTGEYVMRKRRMEAFLDSHVFLLGLPWGCEVSGIFEKVLRPRNRETWLLRWRTFSTPGIVYRDCREFTGGLRRMV